MIDNGSFSSNNNKGMSLSPYIGSAWMDDGIVISFPLTFIAFLVLDAVHLVMGLLGAGLNRSDLPIVGNGSLCSGGINFFF